MSQSIKSWLVRLPFIVLLAASMGWLGLILLFLGTPFFPVLDDFWTQYVIVASIAIWGIATFFLRGRQLSTWMVFGAISPLLGALVVAPPASFAFVIIKAYIAFPVGLLTGIVMYWIVSTNIRDRSGKDVRCQAPSPYTVHAGPHTFNDAVQTLPRVS